MIDKNNPHEILPISFDMKAILKERNYNIGYENRYLVQTHSQARGRGIKLPEVHSVGKGIDPDIKPERQILKSQNLANKPKTGQGMESLRREMKAQCKCKLKKKIKQETRI